MIRASQKYLTSLRDTFASKRFTVSQAYYVYAAKHAKAESINNSKANRVLINGTVHTIGGELSYWGKVSARTTLAAAARDGILERVSRGAYRFAGPDIKNRR